MYNENLLEQLIEKKAGDYVSNVDINFKVEDEILVTITIKEYRDLVKKSVRYETNNEEYREKFYEVLDEKRELINKVKSLQDKILNNVETTTEDDEDEVYDYE